MNRPKYAVYTHGEWMYAFASIGERTIGLRKNCDATHSMCELTEGKWRVLEELSSDYHSALQTFTERIDALAYIEFLKAQEALRAEQAEAAKEVAL